jgi:hypothetical protein
MIQGFWVYFIRLARKEISHARGKRRILATAEDQNIKTLLFGI